MADAQHLAFVTTVDAGSITRAAQELGYTQSGVSHLIAALERGCSCTLLVRDRGGVRLTAEGELLLPYARAIVAAHRDFDRQVAEMCRLDAGLVRVGTFTSVSAQWLPGMLDLFHARWPGVRFELLHGSNEQNEEWVETGRVDCAFVRVPAARPIEVTFLHRDPLVAVVPAGSSLAKRTSLPLSAFAEGPYVKLDEGTDDEIAQLFRERGVAPQVAFAERDDYAVCAMVERGLGSSVLPQLSLEGSSRDVALVPLDPPAWRDLGLAVRRGDLLPPAASAFVSCALEWIEGRYGSRLCDRPGAVAL